MDNIRRELGEYIPFILHPPKYEKSESIGGEKEEHFPVIYIFFIAKIPSHFQKLRPALGSYHPLEKHEFPFYYFRINFNFYLHIGILPNLL